MVWRVPICIVAGGLVAWFCNVAIDPADGATMVQGKPRRLSRPVPGARRGRLTRVVSALASVLLAMVGLVGASVITTQLQIYDCNGLWSQQWAPAV
jgi:hypothetical protein